MGLTTVEEALRAARWINPILVHSVHKVHSVHTFDERPWTPTAFFGVMKKTGGSARV